MQALGIADTRVRYDDALNACVLVPVSRFIPVELTEVLDGDEAAGAREFVQQLPRRLVPVLKADERAAIGSSERSRGGEVNYPSGEDARLAIETCFSDEPNCSTHVQYDPEIRDFRGRYSGPARL